MAQDWVSEKYLATYAEPIASFGAPLPGAPYQAAVVVPVYGEAVSTFRRLSQVTEGEGRNLLILVVNAPLDAPPHREQMNEEFLLAVRESGEVKSVAAGVEWVGGSRDAGVLDAGVLDVGVLDVLLLDATREPWKLRTKEGVGRARKMGLDVALSLYLRGEVLSPMCGSADADTTLPQGYFPALRHEGQVRAGVPGESAGLLFPYRHVLPKEGALRCAMMELEVSFRYYVLGLHHAGSPYAYHSLGSALAVNLPHYARVRGVPNRQAGEDFHLLAKLSKLAPLVRRTEPILEIETRISDRVPFGTGPSLQKALQGPEARARFHHPLAFQWLREVLEAMTSAAGEGQRAEVCFSSQLPLWARERTTEVWRSILPHLSACPTASHRLRRLHESFDALATLQFIHEAHRNGLSRLPIDEVFDLAVFLPSGLTLEEQHRYCVHTELSLSASAGLSSS